MADNLYIRLATPEDAPQLATLAAYTFDVAYPNVSEEDRQYMDEYIAEAFHPEAIRKSLADARISVWLALDGHHMVGYAKLVRYQYPSHQRLGPWANLEKLYLSPQAQNQGVGSQLMRVVLDTVQQERFERLWVGVWGSVNQGAVRFYERWGFAHTGHYDFKMGGKVYQDWLMELPLPAQTYS